MFLEKSGLLIELVWGCSVGSKNVSNLVTCGQTALILWLFDRTAKPKEMSVEGDLKREIQFSFFTKTQCHLASFPVILYYLSPIDKAVFNAQVRRYWLVRVCFPFVCMQRWQLCYQRLFGFFCGSWLSGSCLLIGSVWLLHHMGGEMGSCWCNIVFALRLK